MIYRRRYAFMLALALTALAVSPLMASGQEPESLDKKLDRATALARNDRPDQLRQVAPLCEEVLADKQATDEQKIRALSVLAEAQGRQKSPAEQFKTAQRIRQLMPQSKLAEQASLLLQAELLRGQNKPAEAFEKVRELTQRQPDNPEGLSALRPSSAWRPTRRRKPTRRPRGRRACQGERRPLRPGLERRAGVGLSQ